MRTKKALMNLSYATLSQMVVFVSGFIIPALIIGHYGSVVNGMISSIKQFLIYLAVVETGISASSVVALYKPVAVGNIEEINGIISATRYFYRRVGSIFIVFTCLLMIVYPFIVRTQVSPVLAAVMILIMAGSGVSDFFLLGHYRVLMMAEQKQYISANIQTIFTLINIISAVTLILSGAPIFVVQLLSVGLYSSRYLAYRYYFRKHHPSVNFRVKPKIHLLENRWDVFVHNISGLTISNTPVILLTLFTDLKIVSVYAVYNLVIYALYTIISIFYGGLLAGFGNLFHTEKLENTQRVFSLFEKMYFPFISWMYASVYLLLLPFVETYTKGFTDADYIQPLIVIFFVVNAYLYSAKASFAIIMQASGHFKKTKWAAIIEAVLLITISAPLAYKYGIAGVLTGAVISAFLRLIEMTWYCNHKILKQGINKSLKVIVINVVLAVSVIWLSGFINLPNGVGWLNWLLRALSISPLFLVIIVAVNLLVFPSLLKEIRQQMKNLLQPQKSDG